MKIAHLILAHNQPDQLTRLITRLSHKDADCFIHIDAKTSLEAFKKISQLQNVFIIDKRVKITWGSYSIVQATLNGLSNIIASNKNYDYINLLSGQDYPLKAAVEIHQFLRERKGKLFMEYYSIEQEWKEAIPRIKKYHLTDYNIPGKHKLERLINTIFPSRKMPQKLIPVGRSQWFTITLESAKYIISYLKKNPDVSQFFRLTWAPDEMIFQTILYSSPFNAAMVNNNLRYIDWSEGKASPKTFTINDLETLQGSGKLFARKFNADNDEKILTALDELTMSIV
ncbi:beta-1,6-N-acetylglucosaminyltransferase [Panacibacter ginsenosidivorans]|uniref:Peptide O-xylosyltransferase n=1 Tax=Panacibacter ginsenosidivorans TaxID=1813871 RepID=A0A5B8V562_9BACT|nr:beta-1,6-N-acetylglucosaminyltransferase [Panacibacter ginsenosidivorans]QEC66637.1 beta-1,6-N-acetylglucosaminyltransferase [Panacibacter ginsenosidivorans]